MICSAVTEARKISGVCSGILIIQLHRNDNEKNGLVYDEAEYLLTFHILNVYFDKTQHHKFLYTFEGKLQSEQLLRVEGIGSDAGDESDFSPPPPSPAIGTDGMPMTPTAQAGGTTVAAASAGLAQGQIVSGGTVYQMVQTPHGLVAQPIQVCVYLLSL